MLTISFCYPERRTETFKMLNLDFIVINSGVIDALHWDCWKDDLYHILIY